MRPPRCAALQDQSPALCLRGVALAGENLEVDEISHVATSSAVLRALTPLMGGCVETNAHQCAVVCCLSVAGCGTSKYVSVDYYNYRFCLEQRKCRLVRPSLIMSWTLSADALCRLHKFCLFATERAPNNSIDVAYLQLLHRHFAEISGSKQPPE